MATNIFVEGKADKKFIKDLLANLMRNIPHHVDIITCGGWNNLDKVENKFKENQDLDGNNLIIFDANNNPQIRRNNILEIGQNLGINFELFLLPNDSDIGNLETLLISIINPMHNNILNCFDNYIGCLRQNPDYSLPSNKAKVYAYVEALLGDSEIKYAKEEYRNYLDNNHWQLNHSNLQPLKTFLLNNI